MGGGWAFCAAAEPLVVLLSVHLWHLRALVQVPASGLHCGSRGPASCLLPTHLPRPLGLCPRPLGQALLLSAAG